MKRRILTVGLASLLLLVLVLNGNDRQGKTRAIYESYKTELQDAARQVLEQGNVNNVPCPVGVDEVSYWSQTTPTVEFLFGGWGFGSTANYWGLHYVPSGKLVGFQGCVMEHWRSERDGTLFYEVEGDNTCYVEPLEDGWYYFEAHF